MASVTLQLIQTKEVISIIKENGHYDGSNMGLIPLYLFQYIYSHIVQTYKMVAGSHPGYISKMQLRLLLVFQHHVCYMVYTTELSDTVGVE